MKPSFVKGLDHVNASYASPYGMIESKWKKEKDELKWEVTIPANTTATIYIPAATQNEVMEGGKAVAGQQGVRFLRMESGNAIYEVGSGKYKFNVEHKLALTN